MNYVIAALISYLLGTIHPCTYMQKLKKIDIRMWVKECGNIKCDHCPWLKFGILTH
jgi:hypothetical protein